MFLRELVALDQGGVIGRLTALNFSESEMWLAGSGL
jgi:hypothetical protein